MTHKIMTLASFGFVALLMVWTATSELSESMVADALVSFVAEPGAD